jgi:radical SAM protein with 4Fe4S-binding SPASM domain
MPASSGAASKPCDAAGAGLGSAPPLTPVALRPRSFADYRAAWRQAERLEVLPDFPLHLDVELASSCNLKCAMCWQADGLEAPMGTMKDDLFKRIIDEGVANGLCAVKLQSRGESLLHPRIGALARYAKEAGVMDVQLTTNGTLLDKRGKLDSLLLSGMDKLIFSIDDAHDESALEIYGPERMPDVRVLARKTIRRRRALGLDRPVVRIQTFAPPGVTQEERLAQIRAEFPDADEFLVNQLWNSKPDEDSLPGLAEDYDFLPCSYLWTRMVVYWNGDVTTCCRDYNCTMKLGNARDTSIRDLWLGRRMMAYRRAHAHAQRHTMDICAHCDISTRRKGSQTTESFITHSADSAPAAQAGLAPVSAAGAA